MVQTITARSVRLPRTVATAIAKGMASSTSRIRMGTVTVSVAGMRLAKSALTGSCVAQLFAPSRR